MPLFLRRQARRQLQSTGADLGWVITVGIAAGLPTLIITAIFASKVLSKVASGNVSLDVSPDTSAPQRKSPHLALS